MQKFLYPLILANTFLLGVDIQIKLFFNNKELLVMLEQNEASREFYNYLPMELAFSYFIGKEKLAHLTLELSARGTSANKHRIGDLFYYVPWGNIGIFYELQNASDDLVYLGKVQGSLESLKAQKSDFKVKIVKE